MKLTKDQLAILLWLAAQKRAIPYGAYSTADISKRLGQRRDWAVDKLWTLERLGLAKIIGRTLEDVPVWGITPAGLARADAEQQGRP